MLPIIGWEKKNLRRKKMFVTIKSMRNVIREELGLKGSGKEEIEKLKVEIEDLKLKRSN
jgi:hypothetical protein